MATTKKKTSQPVSAVQSKAVEWPFGRGNYILFGLTLLVLLIGYITLAKGSITLSPILLVIGYCVLLPISIIYRDRSVENGEVKAETAATRAEGTGVPTDQPGAGK
jgi:hypothetical protein